jgi:hypothetical protein
VCADAHRSQLTADDDRALSDILAGISDAVKTRGVLIKSYFTDFDRHNVGTVTAPQFARAMRLCFPSLSDGDIRVLSRRYASGSDVNYRAFHVDVTPGQWRRCAALTASSR